MLVKCLSAITQDVKFSDSAEGRTEDFNVGRELRKT